MGKNGVKTVLSIGAFFLGAGGAHFFGAANAGIMGGMMGVSLMSTIWSATHKPSYDFDATQNSRFDQMMNNISSESAVTAIYGRRKWAGNQLWHSASADGRSLTKDVLIGEGAVDSIIDVKFNDILAETITKTENTDVYDYSGTAEIMWMAGKTSYDFKGYHWDIVLIEGVHVGHRVETTTVIIQQGLPGCSVEFHDGSADQAPPDNYNVVGGYRRMAWLRCNMVISEQLMGNNPTVTYIVKGIKVLDTRTGVIEWSDNPAMCVRDFLLSKRYGISKFFPGMILDEQSFKEAADYCDQLVNYYDATGILRQEKRYTMNIILDQKRKALEHLESMFAVFSGYLVNNNGVISLRIEKPETSAYHFTNDTIVESSFSIEQLSIDETPNQYKIGYFDESQNWTQVKALAEDIIDQQPKPIGKGKVIVKELTLDGCTSQSQALRLGRLYRLKNKLCTLTASWKTTTFAMHLQCGDVVTMTYSKVDDNGDDLPIFTDKPWRIIEISEQDGVWSLKAREYSESIYGDITESIVIKDYVPISAPNYVLADNPVFTAVPKVNNIAVAVTTDIPTTLPANGGAADTLKTPCLINGVSFDGSGDITVTDTRIGNGIQMRVNGSNLEASIDSGSTWKTVTLT